MTDIAKELFDKKDFMGSLEYMTELHNQDGYDKDGLKLNMAKCRPSRLHRNFPK
jgi:hypothetical protein